VHPLAPGDLDAWAAVLADPEVTRLLHFPEPHTRAESEALLERTIARADGAVAMYAVVVRETGETAGFVGFAPRELEWGSEVELGWTLARAHQGRGYATEAARAVRALVPGRVVSLIRVENDASKNVARKLGMHHERELVWNGFATDLFASDMSRGLTPV